MICSIQNEDTNEILTFTGDQVRLMIKHAPDNGIKEILVNWLENDQVAILNGWGFYLVTYCAARVWLNVQDDSAPQA